ncbi:hypothetical protein [Halobaculum lipolyticum]|uniref:SH3 domain-containing protein n=1 Tax=Halobaculum lipolyticum TaxID=3032001 RepID=A0ABD5W7V0_9EURY|nr:hypothetical protein [Halobaculum sp. DT31]
MIVHFERRGGSEEQIKIDSVREGDHGLLLVSGSRNHGDVVGYVPYDRLDHVEPTE